jgi:hypothetical protein
MPAMDAIFRSGVLPVQGPQRFTVLHVGARKRLVQLFPRQYAEIVIAALVAGCAISARPN